MQAFAYQRAQRVEDAISALNAESAGTASGVKLLAGGTNLLDLMKGEVEHPSTLIDIGRLPLDSLSMLPDGGMCIGALMKNSDTAHHPGVRQRYPLLSQALLAGASPQLRNMATMGGNLMQRTRCYYFYDAAFPACNKRSPGSGCAAREGYNRMHAIFGASPACVATHPSDMAVALAALDAVVEVRGSGGARRIPIADFHRLPGDTPERDTSLAAGELITGITLPPPRHAAHSHYLKIRDRASYAFALVAVAVALEMDGQKVRDARIVLGGVAHKPWRLTAAEQALRGRALDQAIIAEVAAASAEGAVPLRHNQFKLALLRGALTQALQTAGGVA